MTQVTVILRGFREKPLRLQFGDFKSALTYLSEEKIPFLPRWRATQLARKAAKFVVEDLPPRGY